MTDPTVDPREALRSAGLRVTEPRLAVLRALEPSPHAAAEQVFARVALYELRTGDNHHHVVCGVCGSVADVDCVVGHAPCLTPSHDSGYLVQTAEVTFWGLCPACRAAEADGADGDEPTRASSGGRRGAPTPAVPTA